MSGCGCNADEREREEVRKHYSETARSVSCGSSCGSNASVYDPAKLAGLPLDAIRASRGCADPHAFAELAPGEKVLDLGSGGGIDCLLAAREVGEGGEVIGLDMTDEMLELAEKNRREAGMDNVRFMKGFLEDIPLEDGCMDVVISNCVINLCPDKAKVLAEAARVLRPGGRFVVADIVRLKEVSEDTNVKMTTFLGCGSKILTQKEYMDVLSSCGFGESQIVVRQAYSRDDLEARAERKGTKELLSSVDAAEAPDAYAGAMVMARRRG